MKKTYIIITLLLFVSLIVSCSKSALSDDAVCYEYGKITENSVIIDGNIYYRFNGKVNIGLSEGISKGKVSIYLGYFNDNGEITSVIPKQSLILNKNKVYSLNFSIHYKYIKNKDNQFVEVKDWCELLYIYEGYNLLVDQL